MGPTLRSLCPARCRGHLAPTPALTSPSSSRAAREADARRSPTTRRGRSHRVTITPAALMDLMFDADYIPPLRALAARRRPLRAGRRRRAARPPDPRGRARSTTSARRATSRPPATRRSARRRRCRGIAGTPIDQRAAVAAAADRARSPASAFAPFDAAGRRRGRDRPLPALAGRPARRPRPPRRCRIRPCRR